MAIARPTPEELAALKNSFLKARAIPLMHLVSQFYSPSDAKSPAAVDAKANGPAMTRNEAFSRLIARLSKEIHLVMKQSLSNILGN